MSNSHPNAHSSAGAYSNAAVVAADLAAVGTRASRVAYAKLTHVAMILERKIKANASGRPGPRAETGDYRRSWTTRTRVMLTGAEAVVSTNKPQARRLEYGFVGADRTGREYNQPPFPHVGPAMDGIEPELMSALSEIGRWA